MKKPGYLLAVKWFICIVVIIGLIASSIFMVLRSTSEKAEIPEEPEIEMRDDILVKIDPGHGDIRVSQVEKNYSNLRNTKRLKVQ